MSGSAYHPRSNWLGLNLGERIINISAAGIRVSVLTDAGRIATFLDESIGKSIFLLCLLNHLCELIVSGILLLNMIVVMIVSYFLNMVLIILCYFSSRTWSCSSGTPFANVYGIWI